MARGHGKITVTVWSADNDFDVLSPTAQWLYAYLLAHPRLSLVGTLDLTPGRWSRLSKQATVELVNTAVYELEAARYLIVDRDTEEVAVRTFCRHDLDPNRMNRNLAAGLWRAWQGVLSPFLRSAVIHEMSPELWAKIEGSAPPAAKETRRSPRLEPEPPVPVPTESDDPVGTDEPPPVANHKTPTRRLPSTFDETRVATSIVSPTGRDAPAEADDDEKVAAPSPRQNADERHALARAGCVIVGERSYTVANIERGGTIRNPDGYQAACIAGAIKDHLPNAVVLAHDHPEWTPERIADELDRGYPDADHGAEPSPGKTYAHQDAERLARAAGGDPADVLPMAESAGRARALRAALRGHA